jgi:hypothetical protein
MSDSNALIAWRNDSETRKYVRKTSLVQPEEHLKWITSRIAGKAGEILRIVETTDEHIPVALVFTTFNPKDVEDVPEIHYRVAPEWRRRGIASVAVPMFIREIIPGLERGGRFKIPIIEGHSHSESIARRLGLSPGNRGPVSDDDPRILVEWV